VWVYPPLARIPRLWEFNGDAFMIIEKSTLIKTYVILINNANHVVRKWHFQGRK
jgi:hypothetical protein